ncbi:MAG TPA: hypothetical protein VFK70_06475 [Vicinamibacteria bacterium]|nr:hypothetical protein [Vicinamibacteria bacterium]
MSCASSPKTCTTLVPEPQVDADAVQVVFLGVGGLIVRWQGAAVMAAPLYSNPTIGEIVLSEIHPDRQRIDALMLQDVKGVRAILSGHAHYDHLMDVPYVALHKASHADLVGNNAMVKLLEPIRSKLGPQQKLVSLESPSPPVYEVPGTRFRIRSVASQHSPQIGPHLANWATRVLLQLTFPNVTLWRGEDEDPARELPVRAGNWTAGTTQAFVIELLDAGGDTAFRIYYQDSPTVAPFGFPDPPTTASRYNLAILCMGGATEYRAFPADIVRHLSPSYVMGIHWEDFFNPRPIPAPGVANVREKIAYAPGVKEGKFLDKVREAQPAGGRAIVPCPDQVATFRKDGGGWRLADATGWSKPR